MQEQEHIFTLLDKLEQLRKHINNLQKLHRVFLLVCLLQQSAQEIQHPLQNSGVDHIYYFGIRRGLELFVG